MRYYWERGTIVHRRGKIEIVWSMREKRDWPARGMYFTVARAVVRAPSLRRGRLRNEGIATVQAYRDDSIAAAGIPITRRKLDYRWFTSTPGWWDRGDGGQAKTLRAAIAAAERAAVARWG